MFFSAAQRANRRKLMVFAGTFLLLAAMGLVYCYARPAVYLASSRVQVNPGSVQVEAALQNGGSQGTNSVRSLLSELQVMTSRPLVEAVLAALPAALQSAAKALPLDAVTAVQNSLLAQVVQGTDVVEISSKGPQPELAAGLVNGVIVAYTDQLQKAYQRTAGDSVAQATDEVAKLKAKVEQRRAQLEAFRVKYSIVSLERDENETLGRVKGQTEALNKAQERVAIAEGKYRSASESIATGRATASSSKPDPTLSNLEQRASAVREEIVELNRSYTPEYLKMDPRARANQLRLAELERQIAAQKNASVQTASSDQQAGLADAREELNASRESVKRLQVQAGASRGALQQFSGRFNEYRSLTAELAPLEAMLRDASQRKERLEAGEAARRPSVRVLEPAIAPSEAWQPQYTRDAALVLAGALVAALLAVWLVELFNREEPLPTVVVAQAAYPSFGHEINGQLALQRNRPMALGQGSGASLQHQPTAGLLEAPYAQRELLQEEVALILRNASPTVRLLVHLVLRGVSPQEAVALKAADVNFKADVLHIGGDSPRVLAVDAALAAHIALAVPAGPAMAVPENGLAASGGPSGAEPQGAEPQGDVASGHGRALLARAPSTSASLVDLSTELLYAAHDAAIDQPADITPDVLRHTHAAFLARQGIRLSDLARVLGKLKPEQATLYSGMSPPGTRLSLEEVDRLMPAAREDTI